MARLWTVRSMAASHAPDPESWWQIVAAVFGGGAVALVWRPLGQWAVSRWDAGVKERRDELGTCREQIAALREQFEAYRTESQRTILELSIKVATLQTQVVDRERDVLELREQLHKPPRRSAAAAHDEGR